MNEVQSQYLSVLGVKSMTEKVVKTFHHEYREDLIHLQASNWERIEHTQGRVGWVVVAQGIRGGKGGCAFFSLKHTRKTFK